MLNSYTEATQVSGNRKQVLGWRRLRTLALVSLFFSILLLPAWKASWAVLFGRLLLVGFIQLLIFGLLERWPKRLPRWLARWALQILGVAVIVPFAVAFAYAITTLGDPVPWWQDELRLQGFRTMTTIGVLITPWIALVSLYRQISGTAQRQALAFELERSEFERQSLNDRLRLLQAQVEPHFLFNTLANVRELVDSGSPKASSVLSSLIAYLRTAVPQLRASTSLLVQELEMVRAYLEIMHMRMPDRLQFALHVDDAANSVVCPPMTLLTLVENAVIGGQTTELAASSTCSANCSRSGIRMCMISK